MTRPFVLPPCGRPVMPADMKPGQRIQDLAASLKARGYALAVDGLLLIVVRLH